MFRSAFTRPLTFRAPPRRDVSTALVALGLTLVASACQSSKPGPAPSPTVASSGAAHDAPAASGPRSEGLGSVSGVVRVKGDEAPVIASMASKIPVGKCFRAHETYSKLLREGPGRTLADVFIAVTRYQGEPAKPPEEVRIEARDCAYDRRTVAMQLGQTIAVYNVGSETYTPQLMGYPGQALILAVPGGDPVRFTPTKIGVYQLIDRTHEFVFADVFVVEYPTVAVSGADGKFEIQGVPPGKAKVNALLPITGQTLERDVEVTAQGNVHLELEFEFDVERDGAKARPEASR